MMVDSDLGAVLSTMFMVQYEPNGAAGAHDHPFEETYLILEGAVEATFDGAAYVLEPGDVAWAGVGRVSTASATSATGRCAGWRPRRRSRPPRHSYRFARDWDYLQATARRGRQLMRTVVIGGTVRDRARGGPATARRAATRWC